MVGARRPCETVGVSGDRGFAAERALGDLTAAIAVAEAIVAGISAEQWDAPTPCTGVDVRALVDHLVAGNLHFAALVHAAPRPDRDADLLGTEPPEPAEPAQPAQPAQPAEVFRSAAAALTAALTAALGTPGMLDRTYPLPFGEVPGLGLIEIRLIEHLGHGWDLARATGQPAAFPDDLAERGLAVARRQLENRQSAFGAQVQVPADAPAIDRLAGFLGRAV
jgi:uncharacterized protein (TIGR03086 family)